MKREERLDPRISLTLFDHIPEKIKKRACHLAYSVYEWNEFRDHPDPAGQCFFWDDNMRDITVLWLSCHCDMVLTKLCFKIEDFAMKNLRIDDRIYIDRTVDPTMDGQRGTILGPGPQGTHIVGLDVPRPDTGARAILLVDACIFPLSNH